MNEEMTFVICGRRLVLPATPDPIGPLLDDDIPEGIPENGDTVLGPGTKRTEGTVKMTPKRKRHLKK
ncbi:MAG: hypothetical protein JXA22_02990 [Candidatus Thermoplasmatota archaeon]|nr:hypothetical protein [Candidatus Thermoplasmatota archaeon]